MVGTPTQEQLDGIRSDSTQWPAKAKRVYEVGESGESTSELIGDKSQKLVTDNNVYEMIGEILHTLKKIELHLQTITDERIKEDDIECP